MAFNVKNDETDRLLRELSSVTGETLTEAVTAALRERLDRERRIRSSSRSTSLTAAIAHLRSLPVLDERQPDEIMDYDADGIAT